MTIFDCSACGKAHENDRPPCPQVITLPAPIPEVKTLASWQRKYTCPQCPPPVFGRPVVYDVVGFQEHVNGHAIEAMREAATDARQYRYSLDELEKIVLDDGCLDWHPRLLRIHLRHLVDMALRRFDDAHDEEMVGWRASEIAIVVEAERAAADAKGGAR